MIIKEVRGTIFKKEEKDSQMAPPFRDEDHELARLEATPGRPGGVKDVKLPILKGTLGPSVLDIRKLYSETKCIPVD